MGILRYATWWQANAGQTTSSDGSSVLVVGDREVCGFFRNFEDVDRSLT